MNLEEWPLDNYSNSFSSLSASSIASWAFLVKTSTFSCYTLSFDCLSSNSLSVWVNLPPSLPARTSSVSDWIIFLIYLLGLAIFSMAASIGTTSSGENSVYLDLEAYWAKVKRSLSSSSLASSAEAASSFFLSSNSSLLFLDSSL